MKLKGDVELAAKIDEAAIKLRNAMSKVDEAKVSLENSLIKKVSWNETHISYL